MQIILPQGKDKNNPLRGIRILCKVLEVQPLLESIKLMALLA